MLLFFSPLLLSLPFLLIMTLASSPHTSTQARLSIYGSVHKRVELHGVSWVACVARVQLDSVLEGWEKKEEENHTPRMFTDSFSDNE